MAGSRLDTLRTRARRKADAVGNNFFSDAEVTDYINVGLGELHDILVSKYEDYFVSSNSFSLTSGTSTYSFSTLELTDFYKLLGVDMTIGNDTVRLKRFQFPERNRYEADAGIYTSRGYNMYEYAIRGSSIEFIPSPTSTDSMKIWYVPSFSPLSADSDKVEDGVTKNWEEYAVIVAAIKMRQKEESSSTSLEKDLDRITDRIEEASRNRDAAEPMAITDQTIGMHDGRYWTG